jgi:uncharacterized membrane protein
VTSLAQLQGVEMEKMKILSETNVLPMDYWMSSPKTIVTFVAVIIGFIVVFWIEKNSNSEVLED